MWGVDEKEATLKEVLAEVSLLDVGRMLKEVFLSIGCLAIFWAIFFVADATVFEPAGWRFSNLGVPDWAIWLFFTWIILAVATTEKSYHEFKASWYFPKLGWFISLLLAGYIVGFFQLMSWANSLSRIGDKGIAFGAIWFGYLVPFLLFFSAINIGYAKLREKRQQAKEDATGAKQQTEAYGGW